jgi:hypothetical protein
LPCLLSYSPLGAKIFAGQQFSLQALYPLSCHGYKILDGKTRMSIKSYLFFTVGFIP